MRGADIGREEVEEASRIGADEAEKTDAEDIYECIAERGAAYAEGDDLRFGVVGFFFAYHFPERAKRDGADESGDRNRSDSIWATVAGFVKTFNVPFDYVLYDVSYANLLLYSASMPSYSNYKEARGKTDDGQEIVNADDMKNRESVLAILNGQKF